MAGLVVVSCGASCGSPPADPPRPIAIPASAPTEVFGHRLSVEADVNGDGVLDSLTESYFSRTLGREAAKYVAERSYDSLVERAYHLEPLVLLRRAGGQVDTLDARGHGFGLALLVNEGDLDGDDADEIGFVLDNADWSNTNTYHVVSWKKGVMQVLFTFPIWDWQLPDQPDAEREYGLIGQTGRRIHEINGPMPLVDLVLPVRPGVAKVFGNIGEATLDTMEVHFTPGAPVHYVGTLE
jgi:hypothetical protein